MSRPLHVAAAQFPAFEPRDWTAVTAALEDWVARAAGDGAELLLFPEYAAMSLAALFAPAIRDDLQAQLHALQELRADWLTLHAELARRYRVHIVAGSFPTRTGQGFRNRSDVFSPSGGHDWQDKWIMTRFEREHWGISGGRELVVFDTSLGRFGITICYDVEFPLLARSLVMGGAELLLAPSCTDTPAGYWRVRLGAQARALENQCAVIHSPLVGDAPWSPAIDVNVGAAGIYTPPDRGLPDTGALATGEWNTPQWLHAQIEPDRLAAVRADGQVFNHRDWAEQPGLGPLPAVRIAQLRP